MKKPFVKGGKALTLAAALLCGAAFLGSFTAFWGRSSGGESGRRPGRSPGIHAGSGRPDYLL